MMFILSTSAHFSLSHSSFASFYLFIMALFNALCFVPFLGIVCCLFYYLYNFICHPLLFSCFTFLWVISFRDVTSAFHMLPFEFPVSFKLLYLHLTLSIYIFFSIWIIQESLFFFFNLVVTLFFFNFYKLSLSLHITRRWSLSQSARLDRVYCVKLQS